MGYLSASIRTVADARVGDTITHYGRKADKSLPGYEEATPMVFCGLFPVDADQYLSLLSFLSKTIVFFSLMYLKLIINHFLIIIIYCQIPWSAWCTWEATTQWCCTKG